jgi:putative transposase
VEGARLLSPEVEALVTATIEDFYLTRRGPTVSQLMREVERRSAELGLVPPSRKAVTARIRLRDQVEVLRRGHGDARARQARPHRRPALDRREPVSHPALWTMGCATRRA